MRKLSFSDMEVLINNQKAFSNSHGSNSGIPVISLCYWFSDINKLAEKYDIDFNVIPLDAKDNYEYYYSPEKNYLVSPRWTRIFWHDNFNDLINLRSQFEKYKLIVFLIVPYNKNFIRMMNGTVTYFDYLILKKDRL